MVARLRQGIRDAVTSELGRVRSADRTQANDDGETITRTQAMLNVTIHEMLHACRPELSEESVKDTADIIATALYKLGARITPPTV